MEHYSTGHYGPLLHFAPHSVPFYPTGTYPVPDPNELKLTPPASLQGTSTAPLYGIIACIRMVILDTPMVFRFSALI